MKQKSADHNPIDQDQLDKSLVALEERQNSKLKQEIIALETRIDIKFEKMERRIDDRAREYNSQILTRFDQLANVLKTSHEERTITTHHVKQLQNDVEGLEKRVTKLENN